MKHNRLLTLSLALPAALLIIWFSVHASSETMGHSAPPNTVPSGPSDWPQWRGPERNGVSKDTGLIKQWPSSGPQRAWSISSLGEGYGSLAIKGDRIFVQGTSGSSSVVFCLNRSDGKTVWSAALGQKVNEGRGNGPRSTPTVDNDRVYALTENGDLVCLRAPDGSPVWRKNILKEFGGSNPGWLISESPLIDGDRVIVTPGGGGRPRQRRQTDVEQFIGGQRHGQLRDARLRRRQSLLHFGLRNWRGPARTERAERRGQSAGTVFHQRDEEPPRRRCLGERVPIRVLRIERTDLHRIRHR